MANGIGDLELAAGCEQLFATINEIQAMGLPPMLGKGTLWRWLANNGCDRFADIRRLFFGEISEDEFCEMYPNHPACYYEPEPPVLNSAWSRWYFGEIQVDDTDSAVQTITNGGEAPLELSKIKLIQGTEMLFQITSGDDDVTLLMGESHDIVITFAPTQPGYWNCYLWINSNDPNQSSISFQLRGGAPEEEPKPPEPKPSALGYAWDSWYFGDTPIGDYDIIVQTITNKGEESLSLWDIHLTWETDMVFNIISGDGDVTLKAGESHDIEIIFTPIKVGAWGGNLWLRSNDSVWPQIGFWLVGDTT